MTECQNPVCDPVTLLYSLKENIRTAFVSLCASVFLCMKTAFACIIGFGFSQSLSNSLPVVALCQQLSMLLFRHCLGVLVKAVSFKCLQILQKFTDFMIGTGFDDRVP